MRCLIYRTTVHTVPNGVLLAGRVLERVCLYHVRADCTFLRAARSTSVRLPKIQFVVFLCTKMSTRLGSLLYATSGGSGNASFIRSDACSVGRCLRKMFLMFGRHLENVGTSGTLLERFSRPLTLKSSSRSLVSTKFFYFVLHERSLVAPVHEVVVHGLSVLPIVALF